MAKKEILIIGAGLGGLSAACRMASRGHSVNVYEQSESVGGKAGLLKRYSEAGEFIFDKGPSLLTMIGVLEELFTDCGKRMHDYLQVYEIKNASTYFFEDGTVINSGGNALDFAEQIDKHTNDNKEQVLKFLNYAKNIYQIATPIFLNKPLKSWKTYLSQDTVKLALKLGQIDFTRKMWDSLSDFFDDYKSKQIFARYATYNGSSPFEAPATLNLIAHVEHNMPVYLPKGGIFSIVKGLEKLALELGVKFYFNHQLQEFSSDKLVFKKESEVNYGIKQKSDTFKSIQTTGKILINNIDFFEFSEKFLGREILKRSQMSTSALVFYWGVRGIHPQLNLHNVLFSPDYLTEFEELKTGIPKYPTIYININSRYEPNTAPQGHENWFVMINTAAGIELNSELIADIEASLIKLINGRLGIELEEKIIDRNVWTPKGIASETGSKFGALYGRNSNNALAAFLRPGNRDKSHRHLFHVGGSVHPGGGIPLALLSAKIVENLIND